MNKAKNKDQLAGWIFILPALILFTIFILIPMISTFYYSVMQWDGMGDKVFIGLQNYINIFNSPEFFVSITNNFKFLLLGVPVWTVFPLLIAVLLHEEVKGWKFFRSVYFFPTVVSGAIIATLFKTFFMYDGPINEILGIFGLEGIEWFAEGNIAIGLIVFVINWTGFGSAVLIFMAGMANFSTEIFEAAELDGAKWWEKFRFITIPLLKSTIQFVIMINVMASFSGLFGTVFMMTGGGPGYDTTVLEYLIYLKAFKLHDMGYASALSVVLFFIVLIITLLQRLVTNKKSDWED